VDVIVVTPAVEIAAAASKREQPQKTLTPVQQSH